MPKYTNTYGLSAFMYGDKYSAAEDKKRFYIIDNQLFFISDLIGDGVIDGWAISGYSSFSNDLKISVGSGIIDGYFCRTFADINFSVSNNTTSYIYMQRKMNISASFSGFSPISSIICSDVIPPNKPTGLAIYDYNFVDLSWNLNSEPDVSHYVISRSLDNVIYGDIGTSTTNTYRDNTVSQNTTYYYKIIAVDLSDNISVASDSVNVTTNLDLTIPGNPIIIMNFPGNGFSQIVWNSPQFGNVDHYKLDIYSEDDAGIDTFISSIVTTDTEYIIDGLQIGTLYKIIIFSVTPNNVSSTGIVVKTYPVGNSGPNEIDSLFVFDLQSTINSSGITLSVSWEWNADPYFPSVNKFLVYIIENGNYVSVPKEVFNDFSTDTFSIEFDNYRFSDIRPILSNTNYIIKVQAVDIDGNKNAGIVKKHLTGRYLPPASLSDITITLKNNKNLLFTWKNSISDFEYNELTIIKRKSGIDTYIENAIDYRQKTSYIIDGPLDFDTEYIIRIRAFDLISGLFSNQISSSYQTDAESTIPPNIPKFQYCLSGDKQVFLGWKDAYPDTSEFFDIWRAIYKEDSGYIAIDFSLVENLPKNQQFYIDYSVQNNVKYVYFLTTTNIYANKSLNPIDDGFFTYPLILATPKQNETFNIIGAISASKVADYDVYLSWNTDDEDGFDGWEIFRSNNNKYSWEKIGGVEKSISNYLDENVLLVDGYTYYYMIRKFRNEARVFIYSSDISPVDSIPIAKIDYYSGILTITDLFTNLKAVVDVVQNFLSEELDKQHHLLTAFSNNRVDLKENIIISDWTTEDNKTYLTTQDFSGATYYIVYVNGEVSDIFYQIDITNKSIIFSESTLSSNISLLCIGISETSNTLRNERLQSELSAGLIGSGKLLKQHVIESDHSYRRDEKLVPVLLPMSSDDGYNFSIFQNTSEDLGDCLTFYDVKNAVSSSENLYAATSKGIFYSQDTGRTWTLCYRTDGVVHKLFYSSNQNVYVALGNNCAYISYDTIGWNKIFGFKNIFAIRNICEDTDNIYITSECGIFSIDIENLLASKISLVSDQTNNCFGIYFISAENKLIVSTDRGLFESIDSSVTWSPISSFYEESPLYDFVEDSSYVFAISNKNIFRSPTALFNLQEVGFIDGNYSRRFSIFENRIIVSTDNGLKISGEDFDIFSDTDILVDKEIPGINTKKNKYDITSVNVLGNYLFLGTDGILFMLSSFIECEKMYNETLSSDFLAPSIFVNNKKFGIGSYYCLLDNSVFFDTRINEEKNVGFVNQYKIFKLENGGWISENFNADIDVKIDGEILKSFSGISVTDVIDSWSSITTPTMNNYNSNYRRSQQYFATFNTLLNTLYSYVDSSSTIAAAQTISDIFIYYDKICKQFIAPVKYFEDMIIDNRDYHIIDFYRILSVQDTSFYPGYEIVSNLPDVVVPISYLSSYSGIKLSFINAVDGTFVFDTHLNKYNNIFVTLTSGLVSEVKYPHVYLEDSVFENVNSGLSATLAETQQSNIIDSEIFINNNIGDVDGDHTKSHTENQGHFDITEYDIFNSTVDYHIEKDFNDEKVIKYVTSVNYFNNLVVVGTNEEGLWAIDPITLDLTEIEIFFVENIENISKIVTFNNILYVVSDYKIFYSTDLNVWYEFNRNGLTGSGKNYTLLVNENNYLLATEGGLYQTYDGSDFWTLVSSTLNNITEIFIINSVYYIVNDNKIYYSINSVDWILGGDFEDIYFNNCVQFLSNLAVSTSSGLRYANSTFLSGNAQLSLVDILNNLTASRNIGINHVLVESGELFVFSNDGRYFTSLDGVSFTTLNSDMPFISQSLFVNSELWMFSNNTVKIGSNDPVRICKGMSL